MKNIRKNILAFILKVRDITVRSVFSNLPITLIEKTDGSAS